MAQPVDRTVGVSAPRRLRVVIVLVMHVPSANALRVEQYPGTRNP
jgi:hypothetical protein